MCGCDQNREERLLADLGQDIGDVEELIAALGESCRASRLPKRKT
jgi:hypothetical protein